MIENILLNEINNYRKLMGLSLINETTVINEQDDGVSADTDNVTAEEIADLIIKTGKTLEEILN
jgi:hypothetical protein